MSVTYGTWWGAASDNTGDYCAGPSRFTPTGASGSFSEGHHEIVGRSRPPLYKCPHIGGGWHPLRGSHRVARLWQRSIHGRGGSLGKPRVSLSSTTRRNPERLRIVVTGPDAEAALIGWGMECWNDTGQADGPGALRTATASNRRPEPLRGRAQLGLLPRHHGGALPRQRHAAGIAAGPLPVRRRRTPRPNLCPREPGGDWVEAHRRGDLDFTVRDERSRPSADRRLTATQPTWLQSAASVCWSGCLTARWDWGGSHEWFAGEYGGGGLMSWGDGGAFVVRAGTGSGGRC